MYFYLSYKSFLVAHYLHSMGLLFLLILNICQVKVDAFMKHTKNQKMTEVNLIFFKHKENKRW